MNKRLLGVLAFAVVVAAAASYLVYRLLGEQISAQLARQQEGIQLIVAAHAMRTGHLIQESDLQLVDWTQPIPEDALTNSEEIVGRGVIAPIYEGEPILNERLAGVGAGAGLATMIPDGKRAVAVRVNDVVSVAGFTTPGMRVDLLIMGSPPNAPKSLGTLSKTLLQNIEILSAGQQIQRDNEGKPVQVPVVNLLVSPEQAEIIALASSAASIQFVLRNPLDQEEVQTPGTAVARLFENDKRLVLPAPPRGTPRASRPRRPAPPPLIPQKKQPTVVEIYHGAQKHEEEFTDEESKTTEVKR